MFLEAAEVRNWDSEFSWLLVSYFFKIPLLPLEEKL